jgi:hypothetical protein
MGTKDDRRDARRKREPRLEREGRPTDESSPGSEGSERLDADTSLADRDLLYVHSRTEGDSYRVIRSRDQRIEVGELRNMRPGQAIHGEVVRLRPIEGQEKVYDVEVLVDAPPTRTSGGPAQVATARYRRNWESIFGKPDVDPSAAN